MLLEEIKSRFYSSSMTTDNQEKLRTITCIIRSSDPDFFLLFDLRGENPRANDITLVNRFLFRGSS